LNNYIKPATALFCHYVERHDIVQALTGIQDSANIILPTTIFWSQLGLILTQSKVGCVELMINALILSNTFSRIMKLLK